MFTISYAGGNLTLYVDKKGDKFNVLYRAMGVDTKEMAEEKTYKEVDIDTIDELFELIKKEVCE